MNTHADKTQENKSQSVSNETSQKQGGGESNFQFVDNRPEAVAQRKLQEMANNSPQVSQLMAFQDMADNHSAQQQQPIQQKENNTGLPDNLKMGMENLSGMSLDDVKVHRNSDKPAQLQAHAYAQGTDIHLASGQEKHLPHEAWHVVQQKQGRVKPTMQMKGEMNVNDDTGLEKEADVMGAKAFSIDMESQTAELPARKQTLLPKTSILQRETGSLTQNTNGLEKGSKVKILSQSVTQFRVEVIATQKKCWIMGKIGDFFSAETIDDVVEHKVESSGPVEVESPPTVKEKRAETVAVLDKKPKLEEVEEVIVAPVEQKEAPAKEEEAKHNQGGSIGFNLDGTSFYCGPKGTDPHVIAGLLESLGLHPGQSVVSWTKIKEKMMEINEQSEVEVRMLPARKSEAYPNAVALLDNHHAFWAACLLGKRIKVVGHARKLKMPVNFKSFNQVEVLRSAKDDTMENFKKRMGM